MTIALVIVGSVLLLTVLAFYVRLVSSALSAAPRRMLYNPAIRRLAWREMRANWAAASLSAALIAAIAAVGAFGALQQRARASSPSASEQLSETLGEADFLLSNNFGATRVARVAIRAAIGNAALVPVRTDDETARILRTNRHVGAHVVRYPVDDQTATGILRLVDGRAPDRNQGEVAVAATMAKKFGLRIGDELELGPATGRERLRIVGRYETRVWGAFGSDIAINRTFEEAPLWLVNLGPGYASESRSRAAITRLADLRIGSVGSTEHRWNITPEGPKDRLFEELGTLLVHIFLLPVGVVPLAILAGTVSAAAQSLTSRRRLQTVGLLAVNGAQPHQIAAVGSFEAILTAITGCAFGFLGFAAWFVTGQHRPWHVDQTLLRDAPFPFFGLLVVAAVIVLHRASSSRAPAFDNSGVSIAAALAGRDSEAANRPQASMFWAPLFAGMLLVGFFAQVGNDGGSTVRPLVLGILGLAVAFAARAALRRSFAFAEICSARLPSVIRLGVRRVARSEPTIRSLSQAVALVLLVMFVGLAGIGAASEYAFKRDEYNRPTNELLIRWTAGPERDRQLTSIESTLRRELGGLEAFRLTFVAIAADTFLYTVDNVSDAPKLLRTASGVAAFNAGKVVALGGSEPPLEGSSPPSFADGLGGYMLAPAVASTGIERDWPVTLVRADTLDTWPPLADQRRLEQSHPANKPAVSRAVLIRADKPIDRRARERLRSELRMFDVFVETGYPSDHDLHPAISPTPQNDPLAPGQTTLSMGLARGPSHRLGALGLVCALVVAVLGGFGLSVLRVEGESERLALRDLGTGTNALRVFGGTEGLLLGLASTMVALGGACVLVFAAFATRTAPRPGLFETLRMLPWSYLAVTALACVGVSALMGFALAGRSPRSPYRRPEVS